MTGWMSSMRIAWYSGCAPQSIGEQIGNEMGHDGAGKGVFEKESSAGWLQLAKLRKLTLKSYPKRLVSQPSELRST